ncbi:MAG: phage holin family protein [Gemmatimonadaceae bacterium]|nr:phage holin family protein [Gemmatimonadaceae bacterium]
MAVMVRQLAVDSQRLLADEVRLARLEIDAGARHATRGVAGIAAAFGIGVIAASSATVLFAMLVGELTGRLWLGALIVGALELIAGAVFYVRGRATLSAPALDPLPRREARAVASARVSPR